MNNVNLKRLDSLVMNKRRVKFIVGRKNALLSQVPSFYPIQSIHFYPIGSIHTDKKIGTCDGINGKTSSQFICIFWKAFSPLSSSFHTLHCEPCNYKFFKKFLDILEQPSGWKNYAKKKRLLCWIHSLLHAEH